MGDVPTMHALFGSNRSNSIHMSNYDDDNILLPNDNKSRVSDNDEATYQRARFLHQHITHNLEQGFSKVAMKINPYGVA